MQLQNTLFTLIIYKILFRVSIGLVGLYFRETTSFAGCSIACLVHNYSHYLFYLFPYLCCRSLTDIYVTVFYVYGGWSIHSFIFIIVILEKVQPSKIQNTKYPDFWHFKKMKENNIIFLQAVNKHCSCTHLYIY